MDNQTFNYHKCIDCNIFFIFKWLNFSPFDHSILFVKLIIFFSIIKIIRGNFLINNKANKVLIIVAMIQDFFVAVKYSRQPSAQIFLYKI